VTKYLILIVYFGVLFALGYFASKRIKGIKDYYVGGKKLGYWVVAFSARATGESGWLLLGVTGMGAMVGFQAFWVVVGEVIGVAIAWFFMAKPFKHLSDKYDSITIPDYLESHFKSTNHVLRIISASTLTVFVTIYVSSQIDATGAAFESFLGWNYYSGALVGFAIVVIYIFSGGFVAVAWSDLFQGLIMLIGLVLLPAAAFFSIDNKSEIISGLAQIDPGLVNIWGAGGFTLMNLMTIGGLLFIGLGFLGSPQVFVRFMSIKSEHEINKGRWVAIAFTLITDAAAVLVGIFGRYIFTSVGQDVEMILGNGAQNVLPMLVDNIFTTIIVGLFIAAVLSAIMSTIDSLLVVASSAVTRDFYQKIFRPDLNNEQLIKTSRVVTLVLALFALSIAMTVSITTPDRSIFWFIIFGWSGIAATFCPVIILTLFYKKFNEKGAIAAMITGFLCIPIFEFLVPALPSVGMYFEQLAEMFPSFLFAIIAGVLVTKLTSADKQT
jgi:sodium/proline symporter